MRVRAKVTENMKRARKYFSTRKAFRVTEHSSKLSEMNRVETAYVYVAVRDDHYQQHGKCDNGCCKPVNQ